MKTDCFNQIFDDKQIVMFIMAHPDDSELFCAGTIARLIASGKEVILVKMTNGERGTQQSDMTEDELRPIRIREDNAAAECLGVLITNNIQLGIPDGEVEDSLENIKKVAKVIRTYRPDIVVTHNPENIIINFDKDVNWVNHRDHRLTGQVAVDAAYPYSRDYAFFPEQVKETQREFKATTQFLFVDYYHAPDTVHVDITEFLPKKIEAWCRHDSQYSEEIVTAWVDDLNLDSEDGRYYEAYRYVIAD